MSPALEEKAQVERLTSLVGRLAARLDALEDRIQRLHVNVLDAARINDGNVRHLESALSKAEQRMDALHERANATDQRIAGVWRQIDRP